MANPERQPSNPDDFSLRDAKREQAVETSDALLFGKLERLKSSLEAKRPADFQTREFYFNAEMINSSVLLPESVEQFLEDDGNGFTFDSLSIACAVASDDDPTNISFEYTFRFINDEEEMELRMLRPHYYVEDPNDYDVAVISEIGAEEEDEDYDGDFTDVSATVKNFPPAPKAELNRLIASLLYSHLEINYHAFDTHEWVFGNMVSRFTDEAHSATTRDCYILSDSQGNDAGELTYFMHGSVPTEFNIVHTAFNDSPDTRNDALTETDIEISRFEDPQTEMAQYSLTDKDWSIKLFDDKDARFKRLLEFVDSQIEAA